MFSFVEETTVPLGSSKSFLTLYKTTNQILHLPLPLLSNQNFINNFPNRTRESERERERRGMDNDGLPTGKKVLLTNKNLPPPFPQSQELRLQHQRARRGWVCKVSLTVLECILRQGMTHRIAWIASVQRGDWSPLCPVPFTQIVPGLSSRLETRLLLLVQTSSARTRQ